MKVDHCRRTYARCVWDERPGHFEARNYLQGFGGNKYFQGGTCFSSLNKAAAGSFVLSPEYDCAANFEYFLQMRLGRGELDTLAALQSGNRDISASGGVYLP